MESRLQEYYRETWDTLWASGDTDGQSEDFCKGVVEHLHRYGLLLNYLPS